MSFDCMKNKRNLANTVDYLHYNENKYKREGYKKVYLKSEESKGHPARRRRQFFQSVLQTNLIDWLLFLIHQLVCSSSHGYTIHLEMILTAKFRRTLHKNSHLKNILFRVYLTTW